jgi:putative Mn2+ efflux pump MntP
MAIGCLANWHRNSCFHCAITGLLFLIGGVMFLLSAVRMIHVDTHWVGPVLLIGIGVAFLRKWLYGKRPAS